ncbi:Heat shock protein beta-1 [Merluccius polli]|uniref:Heat shock protein beta-1 n=1 Tax=Merluccius polli TaxID=89951 RepID=A0AA47NQJ5_MERPO|nr:Heat shock protein beta-1 [Merluccius polli]
MGDPQNKVLSQNKASSRPIFRRDVNWEPFPNWTQPNCIFDQDFGLPPFLEHNDLTWIDWAKRRLASFSWPGYTQSPLMAQFDGKRPPMSGQRLQRQLSGGVSEVRSGKDSWRISLDVNHFSPEEIAITTKKGYLEISGNHEERQDEHGTVSRNFTRKYKLPPGADLQHVSSLLSGGVLSVEAPVPGTATGHPATEIVIPIQTSEACGQKM